jgi:hypothetical protein
MEIFILNFEKMTIPPEGGGRFLKWKILFLKFEKKIGHTQPWDDSYAVYIL